MYFILLGKENPEVINHFCYDNVFESDDVLSGVEEVEEKEYYQEACYANFFTKTDINWGWYHIYILVFLTLLRIFAARLEILFFINNHFLVCIFNYRISLREFH